MTQELDPKISELLAATKQFLAAGSMWGWPMKQRVEKAIAAFDPPPKRYTMPHWNVFTEGMTYLDMHPHMVEGWRVKSPVDPSVAIGERTYNAIREALATEEEFPVWDNVPEYQRNVWTALVREQFAMESSPRWVYETVIRWLNDGWRK